MFVEHIDLFRCPNAHEESWLVVAARTTVGRRILEGTLGCPVCRAEYRITSGVAYLGAEAPASPGPPDSAPEVEAPEALVLRAAALLGLDEATGVVALAGEWALAARALAELVRVHVVLVNPAPGAAVPAVGASVVRVAGRLPMGAGVLRGAALDASTAAPDFLASAVHALRAGGRLVAPSSAPVPPACRELARDDRHWVAERGAVSSAPVRLRGVRDSR